MRERIARIVWVDGTGDEKGFEYQDSKSIIFSITDQILTVICEEIEKGLLTDEEIYRIKDLKYSPDADEGELFLVALRGVAQAQLQKILNLLLKE